MERPTVQSTEKQFTYHSPHPTEYFRVDYFFISITDRRGMSEFKIGVRAV